MIQYTPAKFPKMVYLKGNKATHLVVTDEKQLKLANSHGYTSKIQPEEGEVKSITDLERREPNQDDVKAELEKVEAPEIDTSLELKQAIKVQKSAKTLKTPPAKKG